MSLRKVPRPFDLHWGKGVIAEEASVVTPFHEPTIQLLAFDDGSKSLRFCAYHKGSFARMPLIVGEEHLKALEGTEEEPTASTAIEETRRLNCPISRGLATPARRRCRPSESRRGPHQSGRSLGSTPSTRRNSRSPSRT